MLISQNLNLASDDALSIEKNSRADKIYYYKPCFNKYYKLLNRYRALEQSPLLRLFNDSYVIRLNVKLLHYHNTSYKGY